MKSESRIFVKTAIALAVSALALQAHASNASWNQAADGYWDVAGNWTPNAPLAGDSVFITLAGSRTISYQQDTLSINSLTLSGGNQLSFVGGALTTGSLTNSSTINVLGGAFNVGSGNSGVLNLYGGSLGLTGFLTATGTINLQGGTITGGTVQQSGANALTFGYSSNTLDGVTVRGDVNVQATDAGAYAYASIRNGLTLRSEDGLSNGVLNVGTVPTTIGYYSAVSFLGTQTFNNGTINLGSAAQVASSYISLDGGADGFGTGEGTFTLGANATVQGSGNLGSAIFVGGTNHLVNNGKISANLSGLTLTINNNGTLTNNGTLEARDGGILTIAPTGTWTNSGTIRVADATSTVNLGGSFTLSALGTLSNAAGGTVNLTGVLDNTGSTLSLSNTTGSLNLVGGTIIGGTVQQSGANVLTFAGYISSGNTLDGVTVRGDMNVLATDTNYASMRIRNGLTLRSEDGLSNGVLNVGTTPNAGGYGSYVGFAGTQSFNNATINLGNITNGAVGYASLDGGADGYGTGEGTFTLGANAVVQGTGYLGSQYFIGGTNNLVNNGKISANLAGAALYVSNNGSLTNNKSIEADGGILSIANTSTFTNSSGALLEAKNGGVLTIAPATSWSNSGTIRVADAGSTVNLGGSFTITGLGTFDNTAGGTVNLTGTLNNSGTTLNLTPSTGPINLVGGMITGGTVQQSGANALRVTASGGTLDGVRVNGDLNVGAPGTYASVRITNGLTLRGENGTAPGVMNVSTDIGGGYYGVVGFIGTQSFDNATVNLGSASGSYGLVAFEGGADGSGGGEGTFTLGPNAIVQGYGNLGAAQFVGGTNHFVNNGTISGNLSGLPLTINNSGNLTNNKTIEANVGNLTIGNVGTFTNSSGALLEAKNGGVLTIAPVTSWSNSGTIRVADATSTVNLGGSFTLAAIGTLSNTAGGTVNLTGVLDNSGSTLSLSNTTGSLNMVGGTIIGGTVQQSGANALRVGNGTLDSVTVRGDLNLGDVANPSGYLTIINGVTLRSQNGALPGVLNVGADGSGFSVLSFRGTQSFDNATINIGNPAGSSTGLVSLAVDNSGLDATFTLGANALVQGYGNFGQGYFYGGPANLINNGTISANRDASSLTINNNGQLTNNGVVEARNGGTLYVSNALTGTGTVRVEPTGTITLADIADTPNVQGRLAMGAAGSTLNIGTQNLVINTDYTNAAAGSGNLFDRRAGIVGDGLVVAGGNAAQAITGTRVTNGATANATLTIGNVRVGNTTFNYQVANTGTTGPSLRGAIQTNVNGANLTDTRLSGVGVTEGNYNTGAPGSNSGNLGVTFTAANAGVLAPLNGQRLNLTSNFSDIADQKLNIVLSAGAAAYNIATGSATPKTVTLANQRVGATPLTAALSVTNQAAVGVFSEALNASFAGTTGAAVTNGGTFSNLIAGGSNNSALRVGVATTTAGHRTGTATVAYQTDGTGSNGNSGLAAIASNSEVINVSGDVYRLASAAPITPSPVVLANQHVGGNLTQALTLTNSAAADGYSESLNATIAGTGQATTSGSVLQLGAGLSNSALSVGVNTSAAGARSGTAVVTLASDGTGSSGFSALGLGTQVINVSGNVYRYASASAATPNPVNIGNVRIGGAGTQALSITNTAAADGYSEKLNASIGGATGNAVASGSFSLLAAQATNNSNLSVGIDTSSAGVKSGSATITLVSDGTGTSGLGTTGLTSQTVNVSGTVYRLASAAAVAPSPVVLANQHVGGSLTQALTLTNNASTDGYSERLNASIGAAGQASASGSVSLLGAGLSSTALSVGVDTTQAGLRNGTATITLASDGAGTSGLAALGLGTQVVNVSGNVYRYASASAATPNPVNIGNVRVGSAGAQSLSITNTAAADGYSEKLNASIGGATGNAVASGSFSLLAAQATNNSNLSVGIDTSSAGVKSGSATITLVSDGTGTSELGTTGLTSQLVNVSGSVYRVASPTLNTPPITLFARVGDTAPTASISITNSSPDVYTERLNASLGTVATGFAGSGSVSGLAAGASSSALGVALNTGTAGTFSGPVNVNFVSSGAGTTGAADLALASQSVALTGRVYAPAVVQLNTTMVDFGIVHRGDVIASRNVSVTNAAALAGLNDTLRGSIGTASPAFNAAGTVADLAAQSTDTSSLNVGLNTANAGVFNGTANASFSSHNPDLADVALGSSPISLKAQVNNYAEVAISKFGDGVLSLTGHTYTLDFGSITLGTGNLSANLAVLNSALGPADVLSGVFDVTNVGAGFTLNGFGSFANLIAGDSAGGLSIAFLSSAAGAFESSLVLHATGSNASGYSGQLQDTTLVLRGNVITAVPEPGSYVLMFAGLLVVVGATRTRRSAQHQASAAI